MKVGLIDVDGKPHPKWGYDLNKVKDVRCLICKEVIGDEEYVEDWGLARFGTMLFLHKRCAANKKKEDVSK